MIFLYRIKSFCPSVLWATLFSYLGICSVQAQTSTFTEVYTIFQAKCSTCHNGTSAAGNLNLTGSEAEVYNAIVEQLPSNATALSKGEVRIDKGYPYRSFLLRKIGNGLIHAHDNGVLSSDEGASMPPYGSTQLTNVEIETVRQWIIAGAPQEGTVVNINTLQSYYNEGGLPLMERPEPPAPEDGFQIHMGPIFLAPDTEQEYNAKYDIKNLHPLEIKRLDCRMSDQSHHFLLYKFATPNDAASTPDGLNLITLGSFAVNSLFASANRPLVAAWQDNDDMRLPAGTAFKWDSNTVLDLNYHIPNYGIAIAPVDMYLNIYTQPNGRAIKEMKTDLMQYEGTVPTWVEDLSGNELSELLYPIAESFLNTSPIALEQQLLNQDWPPLLVDGIISLIESGTDANGLSDFLGSTLAGLMDLGVISANDLSLSVYSLMLKNNTLNQVFNSDRINGPQWNIWYVTSHTHQFGKDYDVYTLDGNGNIANQIFEGTIDGYYDWSHPPINYYEPLIELPAGHGVRHTTTYDNPTDEYVTFGLTTNEEMLITFIQYTEGENIPFVGIPNLEPMYCTGSQALTFMPEGGILTGNGTQNGQFVPALAGVGTHPVTYTYMYNGQPIIAEYDIQIVDVAAPNVSYNNNMLSASFGYETYQWLLNGAPIEGATGINYTPNASGEYSVVVNQLGCTFISEPYNISVGIQNTLSERIAFAAQPNPIHTYTVLSYGLLNAEQVNIDLYNIVGEKIATVFNGQAQAGLNTHRLHTQALNLTSGIYFAQITINGETSVVKLMQH